MTTTAQPGNPPPLAAARATAEIRKAGHLVAKEAGGSTVADFFESNKGTIKALLPSHITPERMLKIALGALRTTPKLMECTIQSLFGAVVVCAQLGLEPNTPQGHIYLIPFGNKKKGTTEVQIVVGYKGLIDLARRSGQIISLSARVVHKNDQFDLDYGTADEIVHKPRLDGERGDIIGVYAVAKLQGGGVQFEFMSTHEINQVRDASQGYQTAKRFNKTDSPWMAHWEEMAKKTVIRRLTKYLPMSIELANAAALDERSAADRSQGLDTVLDGTFTVMADGDVDQTEGVAAVEEAKTLEHDPETGEVFDAEPANEERGAKPAATKAAPKPPVNKPAPTEDLSDDNLFGNT